MPLIDGMLRIRQYEVPSPMKRAMDALFILGKVDYGGKGRAYGTTKIKGSPNAPVRARVLLMRERDAVVVAETFSDAVTGAYEFKGFNPSITYVAIAIAIDHAYRGVIADNLTIETMP